jgi:ketosteroid isomerase-like protein
MTATGSRDRLAAHLKIVDEHIARENQHDLEGILRTFGRAARYDDEPWDGHYIGHEGVRSYYESLLKALPDLRIEVQQRYASNDAVVVEVIITNTILARGGVCRRRVVRFVFRCAVSSCSTMTIA